MAKGYASEDSREDTKILALGYKKLALSGYKAIPG